MTQTRGLMLTLLVLGLLIVSAQLSYKKIGPAPIKLYFSAKNNSVLQGYVQVPQGGNPVTSSRKRPTFAELGIDHLSFQSNATALLWAHHGFYEQHQDLHPSSTAVLTTPLKSHNISIPANTPITTRTLFDWWRWSWLKCLYGPFHHLLIAPEWGMVLVNFDYHFKTPQKESDRHFHAINATYGYNIQLHWGSFNFLYHVMKTLPWMNFHLSQQVFQIQIPIVQGPQLSLALSMGAGREAVRYKDHQPMPNDIYFKLPFYGSIGLVVLEKNTPVHKENNLLQDQR